MLEQNLITYLILELARVGADTIRKKFFSKSHRIPIRPQTGKNVQFTPYPLIWELIYDDLPMEMTKLKFARHSSLAELYLAKIKHENILVGSL